MRVLEVAYHPPLTEGWCKPADPTADDLPVRATMLRSRSDGLALRSAAIDARFAFRMYDGSDPNRRTV